MTHPFLTPPTPPKETHIVRPKETPAEVAERRQWASAHLGSSDYSMSCTVAPGSRVLRGGDGAVIGTVTSELPPLTGQVVIGGASTAPATTGHCTVPRDFDPVALAFNTTEQKRDDLLDEQVFMFVEALGPVVGADMRRVARLKPGSGATVREFQGVLMHFCERVLDMKAKVEASAAVQRASAEEVVRARRELLCVHEQLQSRLDGSMLKREEVQRYRKASTTVYGPDLSEP